MSDFYVPYPGVVDDAGFVHIPIRIADYLKKPDYRPSKRQQLRNLMAQGSDGETRYIAMTQADYIKYWAKDDEGNFLLQVEEPPKGRVEWLRYQVRVNEEWRKWGQIRMLATSRWSAVYW